MICPHCGKSTQPKEICDHCKKPTEFVQRSHIYPEEIPGIKEKNDCIAENDDKQPGGKRNSGKFVYAAVVVLTAIAACVGYLCFLLNKPQSIGPAETTVSQTELPCTEEVRQTYQVLLIRNTPWQTEMQEEDSVIRFGELLPVLSGEQDYTFLGWNTSPTGEGMFFRPGDRFLIHLAEDLVLYGQWELDTTPSIENSLPDFDFLPQETENTIYESIETTETTEPVKTDEKLLLEEDAEGGEQL